MADKIPGDLETWMEQGLKRPETRPSILGVDQEMFACYGSNFDGNPLSEFCSISWNLLDCFATAVISAPDFRFPTYPLLVRCRLREDQGTLTLHLIALLTEDEKIHPVVMTETSQVWIGSYLRRLARAKGIELGSIYWGQCGSHLFFAVGYPRKETGSREAGLGEADPDGEARWAECELAVGMIDSTVVLRAKQASSR